MFATNLTTANLLIAAICATPLLCLLSFVYGAVRGIDLAERVHRVGDYEPVHNDRA